MEDGRCVGYCKATINEGYCAVIVVIVVVIIIVVGCCLHGVVVLELCTKVPCKAETRAERKASQCVLLCLILLWMAASLTGCH